LLKLRGNTIGRTESTTAFNAARDESMNQAIEQGLVRRESIQRIWDATGDGKTRASHMAAEADSRRNPRGPNEPFSVGGALMMYPGDQNGPAREVINCRCFLIQRVDWIQEELAA